MPLISVEMDDSGVRTTLQRVAGAVRSTNPLMQTLANIQLRSTMENFRRGAFDGQTWPSLQPSTAKAYVQHRRRGTGPGSPGRRRRGYANLLHPTGRHLLNRLHASHTNVEARVLVAQPWAHVHNFGLPMKYFTMPKRTFLGFSRQDLHDLEAAILRYGEREALGGLR